MRPKTKIFLSVSAIFLGGLWLSPPFKSPPNQKEPQVSTRLAPKKQVKPNRVSKPTTQQDTFAERTEPQVSLSKECRNLWTQLQNIDLTKNRINLNKFDTVKACSSDQLPSSLAKHHTDFQIACNLQELNNPKSIAKGRGMVCQRSLFHYRAAIIDLATNNTPLNEINNPQILTAKLVNKLNLTDTQQMVRIAERILEIEPNHETAHRALVMAYYAIARKQAQGMPESTHWERVWAVADASKNNAPQLLDRNLSTDLILEYTQYRDADRLLEIAKEAREHHPESAIPFKFLAIAEFDRGNIQLATKYLHRFANLSGDPTAQETIKRIRSGNKKPFRLRLSTPIHWTDSTLAE